MRRMGSTLALVALLVGTSGWALAAEPPPHRGTGIVTAISPTRVVLKEAEGVHALTITKATRIEIAAEHGVARIGVGDYVAEECVPDGKGGLRAVSLTLYRPAWLEISSPEN
jgi:hypothetical protein